MSQYLTKGKSTTDLLPCAHCGGEAEWRDGSSTTPYIRCKSCGMRTGSSRSYDKLRKTWNRRTLSPTATETDELPPKWADAPTLELGA